MVRDRVVELSLKSILPPDLLRDPFCGIPSPPDRLAGSLFTFSGILFSGIPFSGIPLAGSPKVQTLAGSRRPFSGIPLAGSPKVQTLAGSLRPFSGIPLAGYF